MFNKEFKTAIHNLSDLEKDKLILRLLRKDLALANRLYFELVDTETVEQKREQLAKIISKKIKHANERFYSVGYLLMDIRYISGDINEHVKITKDKFGEIVMFSSIFPVYVKASVTKSFDVFSSFLFIKLTTADSSVIPSCFIFSL